MNLCFAAQAGTAGSLIAAEDYLASENIQIGCLILDVRMPGLSGLQLQQKLEILEREIPIIFVTGTATSIWQFLH